jgi:glyceraldehyde-3-phosphate dehydrogenase/erythrose-4-phosphate dehydrogenase
MTEAKVKVAINGFGRIGELPEVFSFLVEPLSGKKTRNVLVSKKSKTP